MMLMITISYFWEFHSSCNSKVNVQQDLTMEVHSRFFQLFISFDTIMMLMITISFFGNFLFCAILRVDVLQGLMMEFHSRFFYLSILHETIMILMITILHFWEFSFLCTHIGWCCIKFDNEIPLKIFFIFYKLWHYYNIDFTIFYFYDFVFMQS